jgi:hypothetical protein
MADRNKSEEKPSKSASSGRDESPASKFSRDEMIRGATDLFGETRPVVAGALAGVRGDGDVTVAQTKTAIDKFLNRKVEEA